MISPKNQPTNEEKNGELEPSINRDLIQTMLSYGYATELAKPKSDTGQQFNLMMGHADRSSQIASQIIPQVSPLSSTDYPFQPTLNPQQWDQYSQQQHLLQRQQMLLQQLFPTTGNSNTQLAGYTVPEHQTYLKKSNLHLF
jgi:hypothetical protein